MDAQHMVSERDFEREIAALEQKLTTLLAHTRALRVANSTLRRELAAASAHNQTLGARIATVRERIDALLTHIPAAVE
jgi:hypothetical protein